MESHEIDIEIYVLMLLTYLLKWQYQYQSLSEHWRGFEGRSWRTTIIEKRKLISMHLKKYPQSRDLLVHLVTSVYADAVELASDESNLPLNTFPESCPYTIDQLLDKYFYPNVVEIV